MSDWRLIETAPKDGTRILAFFGQKAVRVVAWGGVRPPCWKDGSSVGPACWGTPTHRMPLPDPPVKP